jgi:hypothetical protein
MHTSEQEVAMAHQADDKTHLSVKKMAQKRANGV